MNRGLFWFLHICAGVALIVLLGFHMILMHLTDIISFITSSHVEPLHFESVLERGKSVYYFIFYLLLLLIGLYHGLYGLKNILVEIFYSDKSSRITNVAIWIFGLILLFVGSLSTIKFFID
ncbi:MAG: hypothetical protein SVN78_01730 [Deferribacterota bacterium]|nr:hypothetical protein [Deferribacterota bacterium]